MLVCLDARRKATTMTDQRVTIDSAQMGGVIRRLGDRHPGKQAATLVANLPALEEDLLAGAPADFYLVLADAGPRRKH